MLLGVYVLVIGDNMKKMTINVGTGVDKQGSLIDMATAHVARVDIAEQAATMFGNVIFIPTNGAWKAPDGRIVEEVGWAIVVYADEAPSDAFPAFVRDLLSQQTVIVTVEDVNARFL